jgi:ABC-type antimicrobial peptide transport system permease subunit
MALGAQPGDVVRMVMRRSAVLIGLGLVIGTTGAWYISSMAQSFLFLMSSNDVRVFTLAAGLLLVTGLAACAVPARRASRVDPLIALRG